MAPLRLMSFRHSLTLAALVMHRCDQLAAVSASRDGISRFYLTPEHHRCSELVGGWMRAAGMTPWVDTAGNLWGRYASPVQNARALVLGSHLDTVPDAGRYDGVLGVLSAIAALGQLHKRKVELPFHVDVVGFGDEEGARFGTTLLGSCAVAACWKDDWWALKDHDGVTLREAFRRFGLNPANIADSARPPAELLAYLELHIEQGPVLEECDQPLGIVSSIAGACHAHVQLWGAAGHAGTVPMDMRRDALLGAAEMALRVERIAVEEGVIATVGRMSCLPGAINVIPGNARFSVDIRSGDDRARGQALKRIKQALADICDIRQLTCDWKESHHTAAVPCAGWLQQLQSGVLGDLGLKPLYLMSGAGHDAVAMAGVAEIGLYMVRCKGGLSHHPDEAVAESDVAVGIQALARTLQRLAGEDKA